ncbi:MAG: hypothetical protein F4213_11770 [Boseongicola sp. SB0677_bin_26]|nr:hypothetical protein [Boseongicola sp. SB0665_bin_10]MYG26683.1 hypothetical protein [Boseongicola sp. SB0677_bin_26]
MHMIANHGGHAVLILPRGQEWHVVNEVLRNVGIRPCATDRPFGIEVSLSELQRRQVAGEMKRMAVSARQRHRWGYAAILSRWAWLLHDPEGQGGT